MIWWLIRKWQAICVPVYIHPPYGRYCSSNQAHWSYILMILIHTEYWWASLQTYICITMESGIKLAVIFQWLLLKVCSHMQRADVDRKLPSRQTIRCIHILRVSCQKGPTRHAYAWQIGPFWQDTLDIRSCRAETGKEQNLLCKKWVPHPIFHIHSCPKPLRSPRNWQIRSPANHIYVNISVGNAP